MFRRNLVPILFFAAIIVSNAVSGCRTMPAQPEQQAQKEQREQKVLPVSNAASPEPDLDSAAARMATSFASAPGIKWKKVVVGNLLDPRGQKATLSGNIAGAIETALAKVSAATGEFIVVKRRDISRTAADWKLDLAGAPDPPSFKMIKTLLGADVLIVGNIATDGQFYRVSLGAVDTGNGTMLWHENLSLRDEASVAKGTPIEEGKPLRDGSIKVDLWSDKEVYGAGDVMTINFKTNQDCYITLVEVETSGTMRVLYPNRLSHGDRAIASKTYAELEARMRLHRAGERPRNRYCSRDRYPGRPIGSPVLTVQKRTTFFKGLIMHRPLHGS